jgi:hypothetical protein
VTEVNTMSRHQGLFPRLFSKNPVYPGSLYSRKKHANNLKLSGYTWDMPEMMVVGIEGVGLIADKMMHQGTSSATMAGAWYATYRVP